jgi:hypothetical protein
VVDKPKYSDRRHQMGKQKNKSKARNSNLIALFDLSCHRLIHCTLGTSHEMVSVHLVASPFHCGGNGASGMPCTSLIPAIAGGGGTSDPAGIST